MLKTQSLKQKIKHSKNPFYKNVRELYFYSKKIEVPNVSYVNFFYKTIFSIYSSFKYFTFFVWHFLFIKPIFQSFCQSVGHSLSIESKIPQVWNKPNIFIGNNVVISGFTSFFGCPFTTKSKITIADNSYIGYGTTLAIGEEIYIGKNVKIAANCFIAGYYGHPSNYIDRLNNKSESNIGKIYIGDNVWIGTNVKIMKNIKIGKNSIISAGSVVIEDIPENVIVAGNPAKIVKHMEV